MPAKRRRLLDLTPLLDVIMILLFGTMINSVELARRANAKGDTPMSSPATLDRQALEDEKKAWRNDKANRDRQIQMERTSLLRTLGRLAGLSSTQLSAIDQQLKDLADAPADELDRRLSSLKESLEGEELSRALARLREMQKVFSFVDIHVDPANFATVRSDGEPIGRFSVLDRRPSEIEAELRRVVDPLRFSEVVLFLFSYDGSARDRAVESAEAGLNGLLDRLRSDQSQRGRQFRVGRVGMVSPSGPLEEK
jgi:biopolymer transport protein ExbD